MTTEVVNIPFGEWTPDLPDEQNPGALTAQNVVPLATSYGTLPSLSVFSNALDNFALGAFWLQDDQNVVFNFSGDNNKLYQLVTGDTWTDVSGTTAPYGVDNWEFEKFGERVIAVGIQTPPQFFDLSSSVAFEDLPGSPPRARRIAVVRDFVVMGDTVLNDGSTDDTVGAGFIQWSGFNNSEQWTPSIATQSDFQRIPGRGGRIQRLVPGEYGVILQEHSILRLDYVGPPTIFQIDEVEKRRGTPAPGSVTWHGTLVYYYGWDGFYVFDGQKSTNISRDKVSRWFKENADAEGLNSMRAVVDRQNRLVIWAFRSSTSIQFNDRLLVFNWISNRWAEGVVDTQIIEEFVSPGFSLDQLDTPLPGGIDLDSIPVDSDEFKGGSLNIQAFNTSNEAATFSGPALTALIDTKEIDSGNHHRLYADSLRPIIEGSDPGTATTLEVGTRNELTDNVVFSLPRSANGINGEINFRANSRYQRYRLNISGGFRHAKGVRVNLRTIGGRR